MEVTEAVEPPGEGSGVVSGVGALFGEGYTVHSGSGVINGVGSLLGAGSHVAQGSGVIAGVGRLFGEGEAPSGDPPGEGYGVIAGVGVLVGTGAHVAYGSGVISGIGALVGAGAHEAYGSSVISGIGALLGEGEAPGEAPPEESAPPVTPPPQHAGYTAHGLQRVTRVRTPRPERTRPPKQKKAKALRPPFVKRTVTADELRAQIEGREFAEVDELIALLELLHHIERSHVV